MLQYAAVPWRAWKTHNKDPPKWGTEKPCDSNPKIEKFRFTSISFYFTILIYWILFKSSQIYLFVDHVFVFSNLTTWIRPSKNRPDSTGVRRRVGSHSGPGTGPSTHVSRCALEETMAGMFSGISLMLYPLVI